MKTDFTEINPPENISRNLLSSIDKALKEEKSPVWKRIAKISAWTLGVGTLSIIPFLGALETDQTPWMIVTCVFWIALLACGFVLYFKPQPRLAVAGYWSAWVYAKVIIGATLGTIVTFLVCPSFSFVPTRLSWNPLEHITMQLMSYGGMALCMSFCGLIFSVLTATIAFASTAKTLKGTSLKKLVGLTGLILLAQIPIILFQAFNSGLRPTVLHWILGSLFGGFLTVLMIQQIVSIRKA